MKHRWANFFQRINLTNNTYYNIDDITITIGSNLPSMTDENINQQLALNGILSQKTLLSNLGYDYATEKKNKEEETEIPYETVTPDTQYVSPNDVDKLKSQETTEEVTEKTTTTSTTASQTNNQIEARTQNKPNPVTDRTNNIPNPQAREGRPTK